jgi:tRNA(His) guanylyltransferase
MANTKYAYVRDFELPDPLLPDTFMLFRLDGHSFHRLDIYLFISTVFMLKTKEMHRFSEKHEFTKPNDVRALQLMDHAARDLMEEYPDIILAFGESDEYRLVLTVVFFPVGDSETISDLWQ